MIKVNKHMCKACRIKAYRSYEAWSNFSESWATLKETYID
jgi:hypothetical protein